jgi:hypothetical protein
MERVAEQNRRIIMWRGVPWPVRALCLCIGVSALVVAAATHGPAFPRLLFLGFFIGWAVLLLRGNRWIWIVTILLFAFGFLTQIVSGSVTWYGVLLILVDLALLMHPLTREFYRRGRQANG